MATQPSLRNCLCAFVLSVFTLHPLWADDTEIFFSSTSAKESQPNLLFVLDGSGSMGWYDCENLQTHYYWDPYPTNVSSYTDYISTDGPCDGETSPNATTSRLDRMVDSLTGVLNNTTNINVGLMRFSHPDTGGRVIYPIEDIEQQFCNGVPCGDATSFETQAWVKSSADDAFEDVNRAVVLDSNYVPAITYDGNQQAFMAALRFPELNIPQGATIEDAVIQFTSITSDDQDADLQFSVELVDDAPQFASGFNTISNRSWSYNPVNWNDVPAWETGQTYVTPNLSSLVDSIVQRPGWCGGNSLAISVKGTGNRLAESFDRGANAGATLKIKYRLAGIPATGGCVATGITIPVNTGNADAIEKFSNNNVNRSGNALKVHTPRMSAFTFNDINIPQGSEIKHAHMSLTTFKDNLNTGTQTTAITLEDNASPTSFGSGSGDLSNRTKTTSVPWTDTVNNGDQNLVTSDIGPLVNQIINKAGWTSGNRINVFMNRSSGDSDSQRAFYSYNKNSSKAANLHITYKTKIQSASQLISGPVTDVRTKIIEQLNGMVASGWTPTVGAMLEAKRYYAGEAVNYGKNRCNPDNDVCADNSDWYGRYNRVSHPDSYTGGTVIPPDNCPSNDPNNDNCAVEAITGSPVYTSPITHECQSNHIILLTDGSPTTDDVAKAEAQSLVGGTCVTTDEEGGECGAELAEYLRTTDFVANTEMPETQNIITHTIGFNFTTPWLQQIATAGGGGSYTATSAADLTNAVSSILAQVQNVDTTFVAPGATIDQFSRLSHRKDVYLALFKPSLQPGWQGNLKKYDLKGSPPALYDDNDPQSLAIDPDTGAFVDGAKSYWSSVADGNNTEQGGAASRIDPANRNLYTYVETPINGVAEISLKNIQNKIATTNLNLTNTMFDADDNTQRGQMIAWLHGTDVKDEDGDNDTEENRNHMGDPLHSRPAIVTYGGTQADPESVVYVGTNDGLLHGINNQTGDELFAFMPVELMENVKRLYINEPVAAGEKRVYGLDGDITLDIATDSDNDGIIDTGDVANLYIGMRRGGRNYYGLDVSNKNAPAFKWKIEGGTSGTLNPDVYDYSELGQSWSKPTLTTIKVGSDLKRVLIFGGGYDDAQDENDSRTADSIGRALYIVEADTGKIIWWGSANANATKVFSDMQYSIPSDVRVVNTGQNNLASQVYVGDMGGRVWRFDINNGSSGAGLVDGGIIADLSLDSDSTATRRFYHAPDLSLSREGGTRYINIAIGSGYQAHPLDTQIKDDFYLIRYPYNKTGNYGMIDSPSDTTYEAITKADLSDVTDNLIMDGDTQQNRDDARADLAAKEGWFITMERPGEKVLGSSSTLDSVIKFISYVPGQREAGCGPDIGTSYYWTVNLADGTPAEENTSETDENGNPTDDGLSKEDRNRAVPGGGLAPPVQTIFVETEDAITPTDMSGTNVLWEGDGVNLMRRWYWSEYPE